jgi:acyl-CoA thioesterase-1
MGLRYRRHGCSRPARKTSVTELLRAMRLNVFSCVPSIVVFIASKIHIRGVVMFKSASIILSLLFLIANPSAHATQPDAAPPRNILIFGDSLSAGYGIAIRDSWPALLDARLKQEGRPYAIVNASISGETTAGGRSRLAAALAQVKPAILVLELGANDGLRGLPIADMTANLTAMIAMAKRRHARILLIGMRLPPNYGGDYANAFANAFETIARHEKVTLLPFLLEPIARDTSAFQADGLHPTAQAQPLLMAHVWEVLRGLVEQPAKH